MMSGVHESPLTIMGAHGRSWVFIKYLVNVHERRAFMGVPEMFHERGIHVEHWSGQRQPLFAVALTGDDPDFLPRGDTNPTNIFCFFITTTSNGLRVITLRYLVLGRTV